VSRRVFSDAVAVGVPQLRNRAVKKQVASHRRRVRLATRLITFNLAVPAREMVIGPRLKVY